MLNYCAFRSAVQEISFKEFSVFSSGGHFVLRSETDFGRVPYEEHLCEIILNLNKQSRNLLSSGSPGRRSSWFKPILIFASQGY